MDVNNPPDIPTIFGNLRATIQSVIFGLGPAFLVIAIVYAGYLRLTAADSQQKVKQSTQIIMWAIFGYAVVVGSFFIVRFAAALLGYDVGGSISVDL